MNQTSNTFSTLISKMTLLDDDATSSIGDGSIHNSVDNVSSTATPSTSSHNSVSYGKLEISPSISTWERSGGSNIKETHQIFNYQRGDFEPYEHLPGTNSEEICLYFCRLLKISPITRLLFGLRVFDSEIEWAVPSQPLRPDVRYCFRMRFKVPALDLQLEILDRNAFEYLYRQMRYDMVHECIEEIRYPAKKDNVMGLGVVDMYIDFVERRDPIERIESNYKRYVPRKLVKEHKMFAKTKICKSFRQFRGRNIVLSTVKWNYVHEINTLAPSYLMETYQAIVEYIPNDPHNAAYINLIPNCVNQTNKETFVYLRMHLDDASEPHMKIAKVASDDKIQWTLLTKLDDIYAIVTNEDFSIHMEITGFPNGYRIQFNNNTELESFVTYLCGYTRLTSKWMMDLCEKYITPSLKELDNLRVHGPIGGNFSFTKIAEKNNECGSYIIRQCEKDYDTYYIDINTKASRHSSKTETFKIRKTQTSWILHYNEKVAEFDNLNDLAQFIPTETNRKFCIRPSQYDKPPLLLICFPKNLQSKKTDMLLSEAELQKKHVQIFHPKKDLQWYKKSESDCDHGRMIRMRADWILPGCYKDICVTLKYLKPNQKPALNDDFMKLADTWSKIYSPQFIKLHGITLSTPYTMIMEYSPFGQLNEFLLSIGQELKISSLLNVVLNLVRGIVYLLERNIVHGYIRCSNLFVTKYDAKEGYLEAKIGDPGLPHPYSNDDLPWIPFEYYNNIDAARHSSNADLWAFATTIWEIFSRGQRPSNTTKETLRLYYNRTGGILPKPIECPEEMYQRMMDGWSSEPDKRFNHQRIFENLNRIILDSNYASVKNTEKSGGESSPTHSDVSNMTEERSMNGFGNGYSGSEIQHFPFYGNSKTNYFEDTPSVIVIPNGKIVRKKKIGEGHYGTVHLGELRNDKNKYVELVAIKVLKPASSPINHQDFMREIEIMKELNHPNIVKIKHWIVDEFSIIMEYVECGSFHVYLSSQKPNLTNEKLLRFALDIAKGMDYLRKMKIIHRDLAARNILVDNDRVKISDFGLAQFANADGYYIVRSDRKIPVKWYSPESLKTQKFSFQSDVWSYGVTLFEMFSRGEDPNLDATKDLSPIDILNRLESGERLRKPAACPPIIYESLMLQCWHADPKKRPDFENIITTIEMIQSNRLVNCANT